MASLLPAKLTEGVWWVGALNPELRVFDVIMTTEHGTSYNSYLVRGEKAALIDMTKDGFAAQTLARIREIMDPAGIDYIVVNHAEPDHAGALNELLAAMPRAQVVGTRAARMNLENQRKAPVPGFAVKGGDSLDLGGKTLRFIDAPFLHWPDTQFTYLEQDGVLFSCDVFGFHHVVPDVFADLCHEDLQASKRYYFDVIFGPFKKYVLEAIGRIRPLEISMIGPSHGPVYRKNPWAVVDEYEAWARAGLALPDVPTVVIGYVSCYGYTRLLAEALASGAREAGLVPVLFDLSTHAEDALAAMETASGLLVGSPTLNRDALPPVWNFLAHVSAYGAKAKPAGAFGSFGWSGEAVGMLEQRLTGLSFAVQPLEARVKMRPSAEELAKAQASGKAFAESIKKA